MANYPRTEFLKNKFKSMGINSCKHNYIPNAYSNEVNSTIKTRTERAKLKAR